LERHKGANGGRGTSGERGKRKGLPSNHTIKRVPVFSDQYWRRGTAYGLSPGVTSTNLWGEGKMGENTKDKIFLI